MTEEQIRDAMIGNLREHAKKCQNPNCHDAHRMIALLAFAAGLNSGDDMTVVSLIMMEYKKRFSNTETK